MSDKQAEADAAEIETLRLRLKQLEGGHLTRKEADRLTAWNRRQELETLRAGLRKVPKKLALELFGRDQRTITDFAARNSIEGLAGESIDLAPLLQSLYSRVVELRQKARNAKDEQTATLEREKLTLEVDRLRSQAEAAKLDLMEEAGGLLPKEMVKQRLGWLSGRLRAFGTRVYRIAGADGQNAFNELLEELKVECEKGGQLDFKR